MAYATNIGLARMADICNLSYQKLSTTAGNYIRLETLKEANDRIANATARLPIFRHFDIDEAVHSSSDGQKLEAAIPSINARHFSKYFGLNKGVVSYTLLANHVSLNARIIGANEHESHFVFDILPTVHSTDTHGTNHVNFALLHQFGYRFAPRYRNVKKALNRGEAYHQLRRAIAYAHGGRFRVRSQHEQEIWNECALLVGNAVVYYNALILSEALTELEFRGDPASAEVLKRVSPVAWQHINFYGRYQFDEDFTPIDLERLRQQLSSEEVSTLYATADR